MFKFSKLSNNQLDRTSLFLLDLSKLIIASTIIGFFFPQSAGGQIDIFTLLLGIFSSTLLFTIGLKLTANY